MKNQCSNPFILEFCDCDGYTFLKEYLHISESEDWNLELIIHFTFYLNKILMVTFVLECCGGSELI